MRQARTLTLALNLSLGQLSTLKRVSPDEWGTWYEHKITGLKVRARAKY